jgi:D-xylulose reductase
MILGHKAAGIIIEKGAKVTNLEAGDLVCMEPGIPDMERREVLEGNYHLFEDSIAAYEFAAAAYSDVVKVMIEL